MQRRNNCVAVIGDGAITGGMAFEAMNCAGYLGIRHLVVLNDNGQVGMETETFVYIHMGGKCMPGASYEPLLVLPHAI